MDVPLTQALVGSFHSAKRRELVAPKHHFSVDCHVIPIFPKKITPRRPKLVEDFPCFSPATPEMIGPHGYKKAPTGSESLPRRHQELEQILRSPRDPRVVLAGKTPLHVAARHGSVACIQLLVEAGAEVEPEEALETSNLRGDHCFFPGKVCDFGASSIKPNGFWKP